MKFDAPVPGANLLADTRNYPWHRPPDITDYDEAVSYMITRISEEEQAELVYSLLQIDTTVTTIVSGLLMQSIAKGKIPIDLAILISGPVAKYIEVIAETNGYKYDMGIDTSDRVKITPTLLKMAMGIIEDDDEDEMEATPEVVAAIPEGGLMGAPTEEDKMTATDEEQASMLGMDADSEEPVEEENIDGMA
jgi:antitoxin component of RelBE/YafQ-DinJ toxin-antitoxin module|tara:strand:+ start:96 stop:671 length:576 start_codon:yes stop_codon:yes gene_type:complete